MKHKKLLKKLGAIVTAVAMLASVGVTGFAVAEEDVTAPVVTPASTEGVFEITIPSVGTDSDEIGVTLMAYAMMDKTDLDDEEEGFNDQTMALVGVDQKVLSDDSAFTFKASTRKDSNANVQMKLGQTGIALLSSDGADGPVGYLFTLGKADAKTVIVNNNEAIDAALPYGTEDVAAALLDELKVGNYVVELANADLNGGEDSFTLDATILANATATWNETEGVLTVTFADGDLADATTENETLNIPEEIEVSFNVEMLPMYATGVVLAESYSIPKASVADTSLIPELLKAQIAAGVVKLTDGNEEVAITDLSEENVIVSDVGKDVAGSTDARDKYTATVMIEAGEYNNGEVVLSEGATVDNVVVWVVSIAEGQKHINSVTATYTSPEVDRTATMDEIVAEAIAAIEGFTVNATDDTGVAADDAEEAANWLAAINDVVADYATTGTVGDYENDVTVTFTVAVEDIPASDAEIINTAPITFAVVVDITDAWEVVSVDEDTTPVSVTYGTDVADVQAAIAEANATVTVKSAADAYAEEWTPAEWTCADFDAEVPGDYTFTAVLEDGTVESAAYSETDVVAEVVVTVEKLVAEDVYFYAGETEITEGVTLQVGPATIDQISDAIGATHYMAYNADFAGDKTAYEFEWTLYDSTGESLATDTEGVYAVGSYVAKATIAIVDDAIVADNEFEVEVPVTLERLSVFTADEAEALTLNVEFGAALADITDALEEMNITVGNSEDDYYTAELNAVDWAVTTEGGYSATTPGTYTFEGTLVPEGNCIAIAEGLKATATVTVAKLDLSVENDKVEVVVPTFSVLQDEAAEAPMTAEAVLALVNAEDGVKALDVKYDGEVVGTLVVTWSVEGEPTLDLTTPTVNNPENVMVVKATAAVAEASAAVMVNVPALIEMTVEVAAATIPNATIKLASTAETSRPEVTITVPADTELNEENNEIVVTLTDAEGNTYELTATVAADDFVETSDGLKYTVKGDTAFKDLDGKFKAGKNITVEATVNGSALADAEGNPIASEIRVNISVSGGTSAIVPGGIGAGSGNGSVDEPGTEEPGTDEPGTDEPTFVPGAVPFIDVPETHWAHAYIEKLRTAGIVSGNEDGSFAPDAVITRAEMTKMVVNVAGLDLVGAFTFEDCGAEDWFTPYVAAASSAGLVNGYSETEFGPNRSITRQEAFTIIGRLLAATHPEDFEVTFTDAHEIEDYAIGYVKALVEMNLVNGYEDGSIRPDDAITRAEVAKIIAMVMDTLSAE